MLLKAFLHQFGVLGDEFLVHFHRPFLLEEGLLQLEDDEEHSPETRQVYYLQGDESAPLVVGRGSGADIRILNRNASTRHAQLLPPDADNQGWRVADLGSTNGTYLNGEQLEPDAPRRVMDESVIGLGPILTLIFLEPTSFLGMLRRMAAKQGVPEPEPLLEKGTDVGKEAVALPDVSGAQQEADITREGLFLHCEPFDPVPLKLGQKVVIGRSGNSADMVLPHPQVSRRHAEFDVRDDGVWLRDMRSANGTRLGQDPVGTEPVRVPVGLAIQIADFRLILRGPIQGLGGATVILPVGKRKKKEIKGDLSKFPLGDFLASIEEKQKSGSMRVEGDVVSGQMAFRAGRPIWASTDDARAGADAIRAMLQNKKGRFILDPTPRDQGPAMIKRLFSEIVLEAFFDSEVGD